MFCLYCSALLYESILYMSLGLQKLGPQVLILCSNRKSFQPQPPICTYHSSPCLAYLYFLLNIWESAKGANQSFRNPGITTVWPRTQSSNPFTLQSNDWPIDFDRAMILELETYFVVRVVCTVQNFMNINSWRNEAEVGWEREVIRGTLKVPLYWSDSSVLGICCGVKLTVTTTFITVGSLKSYPVFIILLISLTNSGKLF